MTQEPRGPHDEHHPSEPPRHPPVHGEGPDDLAVDIGDLVTVFEARSEFEAETIRAVLKDAGILSVALPSGSGVFGFPLTAQGLTVPVRVLPHDYDRAREVLAHARFIGRSVDWDDADVGEMLPEVRAVLEKPRGMMWAGKAMVVLGGIVAAVLLLVILGGFVMGIWKALRVVGIAALASGTLLVAGCTYTLEGRTVEGFGAIEVAEGSAPDASNRAVPGVRVELIRDPDNANRERVASVVSGKDGKFRLTVESFGAGWMQEQWLIRASRSGFQNVEVIQPLPGSPGGKLLIVTMARGKSEKFQDPETTQSLMNEAKQYERGIGQPVR